MSQISVPIGGRAERDEIVHIISTLLPPGGGDHERALGEFLAADVGEIFAVYSGNFTR